MRITWLCAGWLSLLGLTGCASTDRDTTLGEGVTTGSIDDGSKGASSSGGTPGGTATGTSTGGGDTATGTAGVDGTNTGADEDAGGLEQPSTGANPSPNDDVPTGNHCAPVAAWNPTWAGFEEEVLRLTNEARAKGHNCDSEGKFGPAPALTMEPHLRCSARLHSQYMADTGDFDHVQSATGDDPFDRMMAAGYRFMAGGENIAAGQMSPKAVVDGWLDSDGHCSNIMSKDFTEIGIGYDVGPIDNGFGQSFDAPYWTQNFGRPR